MRPQYFATVWLTLFLSLSIAGCPSASEKEATRQRNLAEEKARKEQEQAKKEGAKKAAVDAVEHVTARLAAIAKQFSDKTAQAAPDCTADMLGTAKIQPLSVGDLPLIRAAQGVDALYGMSLTAYESAAFYHLYERKLLNEEDEKRAANAGKTIDAVKQLLVIWEHNLVVPEANATTHTYTPGSVEATVVLFADGKPICKVAAKAKSSDETKTLSRSAVDPAAADGVASSDLTSALRHNLAADVDATMKGLFGDRYAGRIE